MSEFVSSAFVYFDFVFVPSDYFSRSFIIKMETFGFQLVGENAMEQLLGDVDSSNTKKQIKYAINRLEQFEKFVGEKALIAIATEIFLCVI